MICSGFVDTDSGLAAGDSEPEWPSAWEGPNHQICIFQMKEFREGQKWIMTDPIHGTFYAEVIEVSDEGASGTVIITDHQGNVVDTFYGSAAAFHVWRMAAY